MKNIKRFNRVHPTTVITKIDRMEFLTFLCTINKYTQTLTRKRTHIHSVYQYNRERLCICSAYIYNITNLWRLVTLSFSLKTIMLNWVRLLSVFFICIHIDTIEKCVEFNSHVKCRKVSSANMRKKRTENLIE